MPESASRGGRGGGVSGLGGVWSGGCVPGPGGWGGGVSGPGGVPGPGGAGVSGLGGVVVCLVWGGLVCLVWGGGCLVQGVCLSALWDTTPPPVNRMTDRCKNITLATTSLRPVKMALSLIT